MGRTLLIFLFIIIPFFSEFNNKTDLKNKNRPSSDKIVYFTFLSNWKQIAVQIFNKYLFLNLLHVKIIYTTAAKGGGGCSC